MNVADEPERLVGKLCQSQRPIQRCSAAGHRTAFALRSPSQAEPRAARPSLACAHAGRRVPTTQRSVPNRDRERQQVAKLAAKEKRSLLRPRGAALFRLSSRPGLAAPGDRPTTRPAALHRTTREMRRPPQPTRAVRGSLLIPFALRAAARTSPSPKGSRSSERNSVDERLIHGSWRWCDYAPRTFPR